MARAEQIRRGIERYITEEYFRNMSDLQQFAAGVALGVLLPNINKDIDIEPIYQSIMEQISRRPGGVTVTKDDIAKIKPAAGALVGMIMDSTTLTASDFNRLYQYIMEG